MINIRYFIYGAAIASLLYAFPVRADFSCKPLKAALKQYFEQGYGLLAGATGVKGTAIIIMVSQDGHYVILGVDDKENACTLMAGEDFRFFRGIKI